MKKTMKRTVSMVLMLLLCIGLLPMLSIEAEAASNIVINGVDIGYANGSYFTKNGTTCRDYNNYHSDGTTAKATCHNRNGYDCTNTTDPSCNCMRYWPTGQASTCQIDLRASQCFGFARYCQWKVYGTYDLNTPSAFTDLTGKVSSGNCTGSYLKQRLMDCAPATHLRTQSSVKGYGHSICIIDTTEYGINFTDCNHNGDCGVRYATMSWDELATFAKGYGGIDYANSYKQSNGSGDNTSNPVLDSYNMVLPLKAYLMGTSTVYPYSNSQMTVSNGGEIWSSDECTITEVYSNGACKVTYPVGSSTRTAFISMSYFMVDTTSAWKKQTVDRQITTYIRPDGAEYGYIDAGDEIYTIGTSGSMTQIFYPVDAQYGGGYKLAWVETSLLNTAHTCNRNEFVYFEAAHPHYNCYRCTVCGEIYRDTTTTYSSSCRDCNIPGKPALKDMKISYLDSETVKFKWDATEHTTHYDFCIEKKNSQGQWELCHHTPYAESGMGLKLELGEYRCYVLSYTSNFNSADGAGWLHTKGDDVYFAVVKSQYTVTYNVNGGAGTIDSQTKTYGKPLTLSTVVPTKENDIFMGWATEDNPTVVKYQPGDTYVADSDVTLVAVWKQNLNPTIFVDSVSAKPGETVTVPVYMTENSGIIAARLKISYDTSVLKLVLVSDGNILGEHQFGEDLTVSPYIVSWSNGGATEDYTTNGALVYLIFQIANDAPAGDVAITVSYDPEEIYNKDSESVSFSVQSGVITVEETAASTPDNDNEEKPDGFFAAIAAFFEALFRVLFFFLYL